MTPADARKEVQLTRQQVNTCVAKLLPSCVSAVNMLHVNCVPQNGGNSGEALKNSQDQVR